MGNAYVLTLPDPFSLSFFSLTCLIKLNGSLRIQRLIRTLLAILFNIQRIVLVFIISPYSSNKQIINSHEFEVNFKAVTFKLNVILRTVVLIFEKKI